MPDPKYPVGAPEALGLGGLIHHRTVAAQINALAAMSSEDRAALARWVWPEGWPEGAAHQGVIEALTVKRITEWLRLIGLGWIEDDAYAEAIEREFGGAPDAVK